MIQDTFGRTINYMRISITDRCNLRCRYCMPGGIDCLPMGELLTCGEIGAVCAQAAALGIDRFKITGGEPLVRNDCSRLISVIRKTPGVSQVTMTTNGVLLGEYLDELLEAGLDAVSISLDTLDPESFASITGRDELERVLKSIRMAAGRLPVKINCVIQSGVNEDTPVQIVRFAKELPVDVRFIEMMPIGSGRDYRTIPNQVIKEQLEKVYGKASLDERVHGNGPAVYCNLPGFTGSVGFISAVHGKFCAGCNRIRLTSTGDLKPCLCFADAIPLKPVLRNGGPDRDGRIRALIRQAVLAKPGMHCFEVREKITEERKMAQIGG